MATAPGTLAVFISSTSEDLKDHRRVAAAAIRKMGWVPVMMEDFGAIEQTTIAACREKLSGCQLVLLIQAFRLGWVPSPEQGGDGHSSITALEIAFAHDPANAIPVLALLASDNWPGKLWEREEARQKQVQDFRAAINQPAAFFEPEPLDATDERQLPQFRNKVEAALLGYRERLLKKQEQSAGAGIDFFDSARDALLSPRGAVPFIGAGIFGRGALGLDRLMKDLQADAAAAPGASLAEVAEYRERFLRQRELFLDRLRAVIEAQTAEAGAPPPPVAMLLQLPQLPMVVATSYDQVLEEALRAARRPFAVVAHVIHSADGEYDGQIVVLRDDEPPQFVAADRVERRGDELLVYRPLGSPLLNTRPAAALEIDTVVITESDHLAFLGRLENQATKIPTVFSRPLQTRPLVFIGYGLDVWHFRLVMQVFQVVGVGPKHAPIIAVRKPASTMEELAWGRLGADLVRLDPADFAARMIERASAAAA